MKLYTHKVRIDRQGYAPNGRYFGVGAPIYRVSNADSYDEPHIVEFVRAPDRKTAIAEVVKKHRITLTRRDSRRLPARRDTSNGNPKGLEVGDVVYVKHHPDTFGTIKSLGYDHRHGSQGHAIIRLKRSLRSASVLDERGPIASEFHLRGTLLGVPTRELVRIVPKQVRGNKQRDARRRRRAS